MNATLFFTILFLIILGYTYNHILLNIVQKIEIFKNITKGNINQLLTLILVIVVLIAGLDPTNTKKKYSGISQNFENIRTPDTQKRPNPYFDIDTYW